jgi:hypothetical protein
MCIHTNELSLTPLLIAAELLFLLVLARRTARIAPEGGRLAPFHGYLLWIAAYGGVASSLGARGVYVSESLLRWLPGLWLALVAVAAAVLPVVLFASLRRDLRRIADATPWQWFAWFHGLRVAALGAAYKTLVGEFPVYFELGVGVPDLLFGLSAFWVAGKARRGELGRRTFLAWNLLGVLVIVPAAPILLQLGLPGPLQLFTGAPDARAILSHPMSIAPTFGVPLFVLVNLWVAWRLWERGRITEITPSSGSRSRFRRPASRPRVTRAVGQAT